jgi:hypothetical protein
LIAVGADIEGKNELQGERTSPPQQRRGGRDIKKKSQYLIGAAGVVLVKKIHSIELDQHHPVCANFGSRSHPSSAEEGTFARPAIHSYLLRPRFQKKQETT